jgi:ferritin-like metal-binding protein YciE
MDDQNRNEVRQYVGAMVAIESHIEEALDGQLKEVADHPQAAALVQRLHALTKGHRDTLTAHLVRLGGTESHPVKEAVADLFGIAAGAINRVRTKGVSKALRDDYTAVNHAALGYALLHTTAHALGDASTAELAVRHLRAYAQAVQDIAQVVPQVVVDELQQEGLHVESAAVAHATETLNRVWQETSPSAVAGGAPAARAA